MNRILGTTLLVLMVVSTGITVYNQVQNLRHR